MSSEQPSKFDIWWNSPKVKRVVGAVYSAGASVVILGALFKIQHWTGAGLMLTLGMCTEAILFALGIFDRIPKEYEWDKVFTFSEEGKIKGGVAGGGVAGGVASKTVAPVDPSADLASGIKLLSETAKQLSSLGDVADSTKGLVKNIDSASNAVSAFTNVQASLNGITANLFSSYESLNTNMNAVVNDSHQYSGKVVEINKNLTSINSIYELQLKNIKEQSDAITKQTQYVTKASETFNEIVTDNQKIISATKSAVEETAKFKDNSALLANQVAELNRVYGNMLNALS